MKLSHFIIHECPVCGEEKNYETKIFDEGKSDLTIDKCEHCGNLYPSIRLNEKELSCFLAGECSTAPCGQESDTVAIDRLRAFLEDDSNSWRLTFLKQMFSIRDAMPESRERFWHIGSKWGAGLYAAKKLGFESVGSETGDTDRQIARTLGFDVDSWPFEDINLQKESISRIFIDNVLHTDPHPASSLDHIFEACQKDGLVLCRSPNWNFWGRLDEKLNWIYGGKMAQSFFTPDSLQQLFVGAGFKVVHLFSNYDNLSMELLKERFNPEDYAFNYPNTEEIIEQYIHYLQRMNSGSILYLLCRK